MTTSSQGRPVRKARRAAQEQSEWFTVPDAAGVLGVDEDEIFAGIRAGEIRVRFESIAGTGRERPLVTSEQLVDRTDGKGAGDGRVSGSLESSVAPPDGGSVGAGGFASILERRQDLQEVEQLRSRNAALRAENAELQNTLEELEVRTEQSLRTVYERDVQIARLEAALEAAGRVETGVHRFAGRLEKRIERLETTAEDKEREIRRLALTLGEARGEIKLLKAPEPAGRIPWWTIGRLAVPLLCAGGAGWGAVSMARLDQSIGAGIVAAAGVVVAALLVVLIPGRRAGAG